MKTTQYILLWIAAFASIHSLYARADKSMLGEKLPDLKLEYLAGQPDTSGKPMIVEFWATWCPPCRASIPHLNAIHASYKDRGLVVIGVTNEKKDVVTKFLKKIPMDYHTAFDRGGSFGKQFKITGIPHAVLVDKTGKTFGRAIRWRWTKNRYPSC